MRKTAKASFVVFAAVFVSSCLAPGPPPDARADIAAAAARVNAVASPSARIRADVAFLADDALEGREAGTAGYAVAADYVAARMADIGLAPGNAGAWFQDVPLRISASDPASAFMSVTGPDGETRELEFLKDFKIFPSIEKDAMALSAPAVFVGYGVHAPSAGHDDFDGVDVEGKVVVRFGGAPDFFNSEERAHYGSSATKATHLSAKGAVATVTVYTDDSEKRFPWRRVKRNPVARSTSWVRPNGVAEVAGAGVEAGVRLNPAISELLFEGAPKTYAEVREAASAEGGAPKAFDLSVTINLRSRSAFEDFSSPNVVGVIEGADPVLKDQALVVTAHLDHTGVDDRRRSQQKDLINNGAMDNALGVAMLLETARRFQEGPPPARTIVFLALTAEEKGLLGADYFAHYPTLGDKEIVANVNLDMPVMLHSFTDIIAFGAERSSLGPLVRKALADADVAVSPDPMPEQGIFTRSDHYRFVEKGVPSIFLWPGFDNGGEEAITGFLANHYHKPSDDMSLPVRWYDAARFADINYRISREIADRQDKPVWRKGDFFGALFAGD